MNSTITYVKFVAGSRQLFAIPRRLTTISCTLDHLLGHNKIDFEFSRDADADGYRVLSAPLERFEEITASHADHVVGGFQSYRRNYIDMAGSFDSYLGRFSSKTRSTLNRKRRKLAEHSGGQLDVREYRTPNEMEQFIDIALPLSRRTYQARLLEAGLPEGEAARTEMLALAAHDHVRGFILFLDNKAVSYLYLPIENRIIYYAFLGYDPEFANLSTGTVLQLDALERLYAERRFRYFDFTEGEGAHKQLFGTDHIDACSFLLLKGSFGNRVLLQSLDAFNSCISAGKRIALESGFEGKLRKVLRG